MRNTSIEIVVTGTLLIAACIGTAHSQAPAVNQYPSRPIRIIAPGPGGTVDLAARVLADALGGALKQNVVVENRPTNVIPTQIVARAQPDGHTLLFTGGALWVTPLVQNDVGYDPVKDFTPIALVYTSGYVLVVHPSVPANSVKELIALAKARPDTIKFGTTGGGSGSTLASVLLAYMTGIDVLKINYKSTATALIDVVGGRIDVFAGSAGATQYVKAGKLKALGITSRKPSPLFPGVPPIAETVPGYESVTAGGLHAPAQTPPAIVRRLNQEVGRALSRADVKEKLLEGGGAEAAPPGPPEQLASFMKSEVARLAPMIKATGLRGGE